MNEKKPGMNAMILQREAMLSSYSNLEIIEMIIDQMEATRLRYGYTKKEYETMIGMSESFYSKLTTRGRALFPLKDFISFCRMFGYDLSELVGREYLSSVDSVVRETAIFMNTLKPETLDLVISAINESNETDVAKNRARMLLERLKVADTKPLNLFVADVSPELVAAQKEKEDAKKRKNNEACENK